MFFEARLTPGQGVSGQVVSGRQKGDMGRSVGETEVEVEAKGGVEKGWEALRQLGGSAGRPGMVGESMQFSWTVVRVSRSEELLPLRRETKTPLARVSVEVFGVSGELGGEAAAGTTVVSRESCLVGEALRDV